MHSRRFTRSIRFAAVLVSVTAVGALSACSAATSHQSAAGKTVITVAATSTYSPYTFQESNGTWAGYDVDLLTLIEKHLPQYEFKFVNASDDAKSVGLTTGKYDIATGIYYPTAERAEKYDYDRYATSISDLRLLVRSGTDGLNTLADVAERGATLEPIHANDARYLVIEDYNKAHPDKKLTLQNIGVQDPSDIIKAVADKQFDVALYPLQIFQAAQQQEKLPVKATGTVGLYSVVYLYHKSAADSELRAKIDAELKTLKNDGTLSKLSKKWLNEDVFAIPGADALLNVKPTL